MKDAIQNIIRERYGFTPMKGDIRIGAEVPGEKDHVRIVQVGTATYHVRFEIIAEVVREISTTE